MNILDVNVLDTNEANIYFWSPTEAAPRHAFIFADTKESLSIIHKIIMNFGLEVEAWDWWPLLPAEYLEQLLNIIQTCGLSTKDITSEYEKSGCHGIESFMKTHPIYKIYASYL